MSALAYLANPQDPSSRVVLSDRSKVGDKAFGLMRLPPEWVPPFLILTKDFFDLARSGDTKAALEALPSGDLQQIGDFLSSTRTAASRILVRSSAFGESQEGFVGSYQSYLAESTIEGLQETLQRFTPDGKASNRFAIVQRCIEPAVVGHMSNERRVSSKRSLWRVEGLSSDAAIIEAESPPHQRVLHAKNEDEALDALRQVAGLLLQVESGYFHCEWAWTGERVWILQADERQPKLHTISANRYITSSSTRMEPLPGKPTGPQITLGETEIASWSKLRCPILFSELGLPTARVEVVSGSTWGKEKLVEFAGLRNLLEELCSELVVVRCDISKELEKEDLLLPTSKPSRDPDVLMGFMIASATHFDSLGISEHDWAFLISTFVEAHASALVHALPNAEYIQVDALWGFPDGLLYLPHDTYFFDTRSDKITRYARYKGHCLIGGVQGWGVFDVDPPMDWGYVLSDAEVRIVCQWALEVANRTNGEVQLMALCRIGGGRGEARCLPWHFTQLSIPSSIRSVDSPSRFRKLRVVRNREDIRRDISESQDARAILIQPDGELLRNLDFLSEVAAYARSHDLPIVFEGSLLGHAYYVLARDGAKVIPLETAAPSTEVKVYDKLVRDLIPTIIEKSGGVARVSQLPREEAIALLAQKLIEESFEVWTASEADIPGELADVLEIVDSLREHHGISQASLDSIKESKLRKRGGFKDLIYLKETVSRPTSVYYPRPGTLPLFTGDSIPATPSSSSKRADDKELRIFVEEVGLPEPTIRVEVSLIPPIRFGKKVESIVVRFAGREAKVTYEKSKLHIRISNKIAKPSAEQLKLFSD